MCKFASKETGKTLKKKAANLYSYALGVMWKVCHGCVFVCCSESTGSNCFSECVKPCGNENVRALVYV